MNRLCVKHGRKRLAWLLAVLMVLSLLPASVFAQPAAKGSIAFQADQMGYWESGAWIPTDVAPYIDHGRIMVPVAHASRALGADVTWDGVTKTVSVTHGDDLITLVIGSHALMKNGELLMEMETPAVIQDLGNGLGRTMLPVSRLARALDVEYTWDADIRTATFLPMAEEGPVVYDEAGTYGPEENEETIDNDVIISADGVILQNLVITGTLTITEEVGDGDVTLNSVTVEGDTLIQGGGTDSIIINGGSYGNIIVQRTPTGAVRIVVTGQNRLNVEVDEEAEEQIVILEGLYDKVIVTAPNVRIITRGETKINELVITSDAKNTTLETSDDTSIEKAVVDGEDAVFEGGKGTVKKVEGDEKDSLVDKDNVVVSTTRSSGGGGGGSSDDDSSSSDPDPDPDPEEPELDPAILALIAAGWIPVATAEDLDAVRGVETTRTFGGESGYRMESTGGLDQQYIQVADIDLGVAPWNQEEGWQPISPQDSEYFSGTYDGGSYEIQNLYINRDAASLVGLFGEVRNSTLKNISLVDVDVTGLSYVGGLTGRNQNGEILTCSVTGEVSGDNNIGGLVGQNTGYDASIENSHVNGKITGRISIGGFVGYNSYGYIADSSSDCEVEGNKETGGFAGENDGTIKKSHSAGTVTGTGSETPYRIGGFAGLDAGGTIEECHSISQVTVAGGTDIGGLVGEAQGTIISCYATGAVTSSGDYVGGLAGSNIGTIHQSYSSGTVTGNEYVGGLAGASPGGGALVQQSFSLSTVEGNSNVGGLAGMTYGLVTESYATGSVSAPYRAGGLIGACWGTATNVYATGKVTGTTETGGLIGVSQYVPTGAYYDQNTTEQSDTAKGVPKSTNEMVNQDTFSEFSFESIWSIKNGESYPYLQWQGGDNIPYPTTPPEEHPDFTFSVSDDSATITGYTGIGGSITIPSSYQRKPVIAIDNNVFKNNKDITSVTFSGNLEHIGEYAFEGCSNLTAVNFSEGLKTIGWTAFYGCAGLTSIVIPDSVIEIDSWAFQNCPNLATITIGSNENLVIKTGACYDCTGITTIIMRGSSTVIEGDLFGSDNPKFKNAYAAGGAGTYTGSYGGDWMLQER
jgi:hypothetical protein